MGQWSREIQDDLFFAEMKTDVIVAEMLMDETREDVFAGVLLHQIEAPVKVYLSFDLRSRRKEAVRIVDDRIVFAMDFFDSHIIQIACVIGLAASFRIKGRTVKLKWTL